MISQKIVRCLFLSMLVVVLAACQGSESSSDSGSSETGRGGSTARMTIQGNYLYAIAGSKVQLFDIQLPASPSPWANVQVAWDIETLFPYGDYLLIGAETGMHIMDNTDPRSPFYLAEFTHARARDPVVAANDFAYVTLRSDGDDFFNANQMDVISLQNISNPALVRTLAMQSPSGLAIEQDRLFVCDGVAGLKIFDITDPASPQFAESVAGTDCNDVIVQDNLMIVITDSALLQYDVSVSPPVQLSIVTASQ